MGKTYQVVSVKIILKKKSFVPENGLCYVGVPLTLEKIQRFISSLHNLHAT